MKIAFYGAIVDKLLSAEVTRFLEFFCIKVGKFVVFQFSYGLC